MGEHADSYRWNSTLGRCSWKVFLGCVIAGSFLTVLANPASGQTGHYCSANFCPPFAPGDIPLDGEGFTSAYQAACCNSYCGHSCCPDDGPHSPCQFTDDDIANDTGDPCFGQPSCPSDPDFPPIDPFQEIPDYCNNSNPNGACGPDYLFNVLPQTPTLCPETGVGEGLHMDVLSGRIWTDVPVNRTFSSGAGADQTFNQPLRGNSLPRNNPPGFDGSTFFDFQQTFWIPPDFPNIDVYPASAFSKTICEWSSGDSLGTGGWLDGNSCVNVGLRVDGEPQDDSCGHCDPWDEACQICITLYSTAPNIPTVEYTPGSFKTVTFRYDFTTGMLNAGGTFEPPDPQSPLFAPTVPFHSVPTGEKLDLTEVTGQGANATFRAEVTESDGSRIIFDNRVASSGVWGAGPPNITRIDPRGRTTRTWRDKAGKKITTESWTGRVGVQEFDANDRLWKIIHPDSTETIITYHPNGDLYRVTDPDGLFVEYEWDSQNRVTKETLKNGVIYEAWYSADDLTRELRAVKPNGTRETIAKIYCPQGFPTHTKDFRPAGIVYYTDANGKTWNYYRDGFGRMAQLVDPEGNSRWFEYGNDPDVPSEYLKLTEVRNDTAYGKSQYKTYQYNEQGNITSLIEGLRDLTPFLPSDPDGVGTNGAGSGGDGGNTTSNGVPEPIVDESASVVSSFDYNTNGAAGRYVTVATLPNGRVWEYAFTDSGDLLNISDPVNGTTNPVTFAYEDHPDNVDLGTSGLDLPGRIKKITRTDQEGNVQVLEYDTRGNLLKVTRGFGVLNLVTEYQSDAMGRVTKEIVRRSASEDLVTAWTYDTFGRVLSETVNSNGLLGDPPLTTGFEYDPYGNLIRVTDPKGNKTKLDYDYRNRLYQVTRAEGDLDLVTFWDLDSNGNVTYAEDSNANGTTFGYNARNELVQIEDAEGYLTQLIPDPVGRITQVKRWSGVGATGTLQTTDLEYDFLSRVVKETVAAGTADEMVTSIGYQAAGGSNCSCSASPRAALPHRIVDPMQKVTYLYYDDLDRVDHIVRKVNDTADNDGDVDVDDAITYRTYDKTSNLLTVTGPEGEKVAYEYDSARRLTKVTANPDALPTLSTQLFYDGADNVSMLLRPNGKFVVFQYDGANRLNYSYDFSNEGGQADIGRLSYDFAGNIKTQTDGNGNAWTFEYDAADRLTKLFDPIVEAPDQFTEFVYDSGSRRTQMIDALGIVTKYDYDKINRLVKSIEDFGGPDVATTSYSYNGLNRLTSLKDNEDNTTSYFYDEAARVKRIDYPDTGAGESFSVSFAYNLAANTITRTDQKNVDAISAFDDLHRMTSRSFVDSNGATLLAETYAYDKSGRMTDAANSLVQVQNSYDTLGRPDWTKQTYLTGNHLYTTDYAYEVAAGQSKRTITYPAGRVVTETADERGRLRGVAFGASGEDVSWAFDAGNRRASAYLSNGISSAFNYDANDRLTGISHYSTQATAYDVNYGYDAVGNRLFTRDSLFPNRSEEYRYDRRHRLTEFRRGTLDASGVIPDGSILSHPALAGKKMWNLDSRGNWNDIATEVNSQTTIDERSHNGVNEIQTLDPDGPSLPAAPVAIDVDRNGNVTLDPLAPNVGQTEPAGQRYVYDPANRLQVVYRTNSTPVETDDQPLLFISYDALGRRVSSFEYVSAENGATLTEPKGTYHVMSGLSPIEEYDVPITLIPSATPAREFVWGAAFPEPLAMIDHTDLGDIPATGSPGGGEEVLYYLHDVLGSVVALANSNGEVVERYAYDPYGTTTILNADGTVPLSPPIDPTSDVYYHDADMNDWIDTIDEQNLTACLGQSDAACVWLHDRDGDGQVDFVDQGVFAGYYNPAGAAAPPQFGMPARSMFDANGDSHIDLWDFYAFAHAQGSTAPVLLTIFDANNDGTVSAADYATFAASQTSPGLPNWTTTRNTSQYGNPYMWTSQRRDATTGQYHFMFRTYSPRLGRWMQRDPLGYVDGVSLYGYARTSPLNWRDTLGLLTPRQYIELVSELDKRRPSDADYSEEDLENIKRAALRFALGKDSAEFLEMSHNAAELYKKLLSTYATSLEKGLDFYNEWLKEVEKLPDVYGMDSEQLAKISELFKDKAEIEKLLKQIETAIDALDILDALRQGKDVDPVDAIKALGRLMNIGKNWVKIPGFSAFFEYYAAAINAIVNMLDDINYGNARWNVKSLRNGQRPRKRGAFSIKWGRKYGKKKKKCPAQ